MKFREICENLRINESSSLKAVRRAILDKGDCFEAEKRLRAADALRKAITQMEEIKEQAVRELEEIL